jgi:hypothetical protein
MKLAEVEALLGERGKEIAEESLPGSVDISVPVGSPGRLKPVVSGDKFYQWRKDDNSFILVGLKDGFVFTYLSTAPGWSRFLIRSNRRS